MFFFSLSSTVKFIFDKNFKFLVVVLLGGGCLGLKFKVVVLLGSVLVFVLLFWFFIYPSFFAHEKLEISGYRWTVNSRGEVRLLEVGFLNVGDLTWRIVEVWIDDVFVEHAERKGDFGWREYIRKAEPGEIYVIYVAPKNFVFDPNKTHSLMVVTERGNKFNFTLTINENNTVVENLEIKSVGFYHWPLLTGEGRVQLEIYTGEAGAIIRRIMIDGIEVSLIEGEDPWLGSDLYLFLHFSFEWDEGETYVIKIETLAGNTYIKAATAD